MSSDAVGDALRRADELELETRGRRTGRPHRVTLWFAYDEPDIWLRTDRDSDWYRNLAHDPRCRVTVGAATVDARREATSDDAAALRQVVSLWRAKYGAEWVADWYVERGRVPVRLRLATG